MSTIINGSAPVPIGKVSLFGDHLHVKALNDTFSHKVFKPLVERREGRFNLVGGVDSPEGEGMLVLFHDEEVWEEEFSYFVSICDFLNFDLQRSLRILSANLPHRTIPLYLPLVYNHHIRSQSLRLLYLMRCV